MGRRTLLLITSILLALVGTALVAIYVKGADSRAQQGQDLISVQVVNKPVPAGVSVAQAQRDGSFGPAKRTRSDVMGNVVLDFQPYSTWTVTSNLLPGQVVQPGMFSKTANAAASSLGLKDDQQALQLSLTDPQRVSSLLQPGMSVAIYAVPQQGKTTSATLLLPSVTVIKVGAQGQSSSTGLSSAASSSSTASGQVPATNVTFAVGKDDVPRLVAAEQNNVLTLAVLPSPGSAS